MNESEKLSIMASIKDCPVFGKLLERARVDYVFVVGFGSLLAQRNSEKYTMRLVTWNHSVNVKQETRKVLENE